MKGAKGTVNVCREIENVLHEVCFVGTIEMIDDGIGPYEFWGFKGFDSQIVPEVQDIEWDKSIHTAEENDIIQKYLDVDDDNDESISKEMCEKFEPPVDDYPDPE